MMELSVVMHFCASFSLETGRIPVRICLSYPLRFSFMHEASFRQYKYSCFCETSLTNSECHTLFDMKASLLDMFYSEVEGKHRMWRCYVTHYRPILLLERHIPFVCLLHTYRIILILKFFHIERLDICCDYRVLIVYKKD